MQKIKTSTNDSNVVDSKNKKTTSSNNPFSKLIKFNKESYFNGKTKVDKNVFIKKIIVIVFVFLIMVGSIVGAAFAIIEAKKSQEKNNQPTITNSINSFVENKMK